MTGITMSKKKDNTVKMKIDATSLMVHTMPWLVISFVVNLVAFSPVYFVFPLIQELVTGILKPEELIYRWLGPMYERGIFLTTINKLAFFAEFILVGFWVLVAMGITILFTKWMSSYFTYLVKAGHVANVSSILEGKKQSNQFLYGFKKVLERFGSFNLMFVADGLTKKTVRKINRTLLTSKYVPDVVNRFSILRKNLPKFLEMLLTHVDETILSYVMMNEGNVWKLYASAIASYVKAWKGLIKAALSTIVTLWIIEKLLSIAVYYTFFISMRNKDMKTIILALAFARYVMYVFRITFIDAYKYIKILIAFYTHSQEVSESDTVFKKLMSISSFRNIVNKSEREKTLDTLTDVVKENIDVDDIDLGAVGKLTEDKILPDKDTEGLKGIKESIPEIKIRRRRKGESEDD